MNKVVEKINIMNKRIEKLEDRMDAYDDDDLQKWMKENERKDDERSLSSESDILSDEDEDEQLCISYNSSVLLFI